MDNVNMVDKIEKEKNIKNITLFLGNGFDLNLGLKTLYEDFVKHYINNVKSIDPDINKLKKLLKEDDENWSDLELQMGKLTSEFDNADVFYNVFCDMGKELIAYLKNEEKKFDQMTELEKENIAYNFIEDIIVFFNKHNIENNIEVNILTLNYTTLLKQLKFILKLKSVRINKILKDHNLIFNHVVNCHGCLENGEICFGVNDQGQISNKTLFNNRQRLIQQIIKPEHNKTFAITDMQKCYDIIFNSDIIINYGCSFGVTDNYWVSLLSRWLGKLNIAGSPTLIKDGVSANRKLFVYSFTKPNKTLFGATELEFEDQIKEKYSVINDERIDIIYDNFFEKLKNKLL